MQGIQVPAAYKHLMTPDRKPTEDYKAKIRWYIEAHKGEALLGKNFQEALGTTSAMAHVKKLLKQGYITRERVHKGAGKRYSYKWHDTPLDLEDAARRNGLVVVKDLDLPTFALKGKLDAMAELIMEWQHTMSRPINGEFLAGVEEFRRWLVVKEKEVEERRAKILDEHTTNSRSNAVVNASEG